MPKRKIRFIFAVIILFTGISFRGFTQTTDLKDIQKAVSDFSAELARSVPFNSSLGLNWSDAYIGKLFPSLPPHFGVGVSFGFSTIKLPLIKTLAGYFGYDLPFNANKLFLPAYAGEARLGGIFLPFDVGFKFGYLPPVGLWGRGVNMNYFLAGGDLRYALLDKGILPKISLGIGINYMKSGISGKVGKSLNIDYDVSDSIIIDKPEVNIKWDAFSLDFKAQISQSLVIFTPYLGIAGSYAWSSAGYSVNAGITDGIGNPIDATDIKDYVSSLGLKGLDIDDSGMSSIIKNKAFSFRVFGGLSLDLVKFRLDFTGLYSFLDKNFGASVGFRFQL